MRMLITGATGFVGDRLLERLPGEFVVLSRNAERAKKQLARPAAAVYSWNATEEEPPAAAFEGVEAVIHLAGEPVAEGRWTEEKKRRLMESRRLGTRHLVAAIGKLAEKPRVLVSASAVGYYGSRGEEPLTEAAAPGDDFLAQICIAWEQEAAAAEQYGLRVTNPRIGIVLGPGGGALKAMLPPFKLGAGSPLGSGQQYMPWIHRDDLVSQLLYAVENEALRGPFNAVAPNPVTNREFSKLLGKVLGRPVFLPAVPGFVLKLMIGGFAEVLLGSQRVLPARLEELGFAFQYTELEPALREILGKRAEE